MSVIEVTQLLKKLKHKKTTGNDDLPPGLLKDSAAVISAPLILIINLSFQSGVFLFDRKIAKTLPLYKNGATSQFGNYHPISILAKISKVVEKIVRHRMVDCLSESKLLLTCQFGFCATRSTELTVTLLCNDICTSADSKLLTGCVFIEFSGAFDNISHAKLMQKLNTFRM